MKIPEDVWRAAHDVWSATPVSHIGAMRLPIVTAISGAILAERKRCADLAQNEASGFKVAGCTHEAYGAIVTRKAILA